MTTIEPGSLWLSRETGSVVKVTHIGSCSVTVQRLNGSYATWPMQMFLERFNSVLEGVGV